MPKTLPEEAHTEWLRPTLFEDFYASQWSEIYRPLAITLRNPDLAREATDEAMVRTYQRWRTVCRKDNPSGWAYRVALNWAISQLRRGRKVVHTHVADNPGWDPLPVDPAISKALADRFDLEGWTHFTIDDGLASLDLAAVEIGDDGSVWFGTLNHGVTRYQPGTNPESGKSISIDGQELSQANWPDLFATTTAPTVPEE